MSVHTGSVGADLIRFDIDLLVAIAATGGSPKGVEIKDHLEQNTGGEVNNGRLYPRLDKLADSGYLRKTQIDNRSNNYQLTPKAKKFLRTRSGELAHAAEKID